MGRSDFIAQFQALGYRVEDLGNNRLAFPYTVPVGRFMGQEIKVGFAVTDDFPLNPPSGPHISPPLLPIHPGGQHPSGGINPSPFGQEWQYWSRPFHGWANTDRSVRTYMSFIRRLFDTQ